MSRLRALIVCPGRGSYERGSLGSLQGRSSAATEIVAQCDAYRAARDEPTVSELDRDERYRATRHVAGEHASLLTFAASLADWAELDRDRYDVVGVAGNSMGWYTALAVSGALPLGDAIRLVDTLGGYQRGNVIGGQVMYPLSDEDWQPDPALADTVERALTAAREAGHEAHWSIDLGGTAILGADRDGVKFLLEHLPPLTRGARTYPLQLPLHSAFHTPLMSATGERARSELADLDFGAPTWPLVDGRGMVFRPRWADPDALRSYTLGHQLVAPYEFTTSIRTAARHVGPDVVICLGPGNPLGGAVARALLEDGWRGVRSKEAFKALPEPLVRSFGLAEQRPELVAGP